MDDQLAKSVVSLAERLTQGPPRKKNVRPLGRTAGVRNNAHHTIGKVANRRCTEDTEQMTISILLKKQTGRMPIPNPCNKIMKCHRNLHSG